MQWISFERDHHNFDSGVSENSPVARGAAEVRSFSAPFVFCRFLVQKFREI